MAKGGFLGFFRGQRESAKPTKLQGASGFVVTGGYIQANEINRNLLGQQRWKTAADLLTNISIIAASVRYTLNLIAKPKWRFEPANDSAEAKKLAEFADSVLDGIDGSWTSTVRRMALYRFHGFGLHEWQAKQRDDGKIGIATIAVRPCHTVDRWDINENGDILGVMQRRPVDGKEIYLPRAKVIYLVDDSLTDSPEGMGWFRHLVEPSNRLKNLLRIETMGFERDLNGIPVGRAPISEINSLVGSILPSGKTFTQVEADAEITAMQNFVRMEAKKPGTGLLLDSAVYATQTSDGETLTTQPMWDIDLLTTEPKGIDAIAKAVTRLEYEMALIMGTESMLVGREGEGSRALSEDKSRNLYLLGESTLGDMTEVVTRDVLTPIWAMNGLPEELMPKATTESISFKDAAKITKALAEMAQAGAVLAPDDPAINDVRDLLDVPHAPELTPKERGILMGTAPSADAQLGAEQAAAAAGGKDDKGGGPPGKPPNPTQGRGRPQPKAPAKKFDPTQPRDPAGSSTGGQWTATGASGVITLDRTAKQKYLIDPNRGKSLEQMRDEAIENQERLRDLGSLVEGKSGAEFREPPPGYEVKTLDSLQRKISDEGYDGPHQIVDISRGTLVVDSVEEADLSVAALSEHAKVYDRGWQTIESTGYKDRKVYVIHPNDGVSEIQIVPRGVQAYKEGQGHVLYEIARKKTTPYSVASAASRKSRTVYDKLLRQGGFADIGDGK